MTSPPTRHAARCSSTRPTKRTSRGPLRARALRCATLHIWQSLFNISVRATGFILSTPVVGILSCMHAGVNYAGKTGTSNISSDFCWSFQCDLSWVFGAAGASSEGGGSAAAKAAVA